MTERVEFQTLVSKVLPSASTLLPSSCCPTRDLIALASASAPQPDAATTDSKVSLWRTTGAAEVVWEWSPSGPAVKGGVKGKGKEQQGGLVEVMAWNPEGNYLAVGVTPPSSSNLHSSFALLSVHTGLSPLPSIALPTPAPITFLSWQLLHHPTDPNLTSFATALISELPPLPNLAKDSNAAAVAGGAAAASGVFGSMKNAMLLREREKEAGRALDLTLAAKEFPTLLPAGSRETDKSSGASVLLVGDAQGRVHLYLGGSVYLGSVGSSPLLDDTTRVVGATVLPSSSSSTTRIAILLSSPIASSDSNTTSVITKMFSLSFPPTLEIFTQQSTMLRNAIQHAFELLQEARVLWDESRRIGKAWLARLAELSKTQTVVHLPTTQLLTLLTTGRPSRALHDFLASKMNERGLTKWETATASALQKLKVVTFTSLAPALEHTILLLDELRTWEAWPEKFESFRLQVDWLVGSIEIGKEIIKASAHIERLALEEERCFAAFSRWIHYELEKVAQQEGSEVRPLAKFQPIPVAHYIRHCLSDSTLSPFLSFGPSQTPLEENQQLRDARAWYASLRTTATEEVESLEGMMKRMKEELRGQVDAVLVGVGGRDESMQVERPQRGTGPKSQLTVPESVPALLHLLAGIVEGGMKEAIQRVGGGAVLESEEVVGRLEGSEKLVRERVVGEDANGVLYSAWISGGSLYVCRRLPRINGDGSVEFSVVSLVTEGKLAIEVVDFDFFDDVELVFALKTTEDGRAVYDLSVVRLDDLDFSPAAEVPTQPTASLPVFRAHSLDSHFPPQALALNGRAGRRVACVLGGDGRRLEVLDIDVEDDGEEEEEDAEMGEA